MSRRGALTASNRTTRAEPITDNTLLRIAVDLLLDRGDQLAGNTEEELQNSVTYPK